ncbi:hypothetical protein [Mucisphaera sp.]|uniref:hypothetical protein n=1 Tax=Mucisphaera sp. TaxID=2913024 RepID=UPI003D0AC731
MSTLGLGRTLGGVSLPADLVPMSIPVGGVPAALLGLGLPLDLGGGLSFVAGGGSVGEPPAWIDRQAPIEPGSVLRSR